jgi:protein-tyrosine-phosphatase
MKVLFVCWANVARSQMAAALYNQQTQTHTASSAGTEVDVPGETLLQRRERIGGTYTIDAMDAVGIDLRYQQRTQLAEAMLKDYDLVINMAQPEHTPQWLRRSSNYVYWDVDDPGGKDIPAMAKALETIRPKVDRLAAELKKGPL